MAESSDTTGTRAALIAAGLHAFGRDGFDGASTRAIARHAGTNVASIAYHFGSKAGLRMACAETVASRIAGALPSADASALPKNPDAALAQMETALRGLVGLVVGTPEASVFVGFVLRELAEPGEVADLLYERVLMPRHGRLCALWSAATGQPAEAETVRLTIFSLIGQVLYFRIAQTFVSRRMGWQGLGPDEAGTIAEVLVQNLRTVIEGSRR